MHATDGEWEVSGHFHRVASQKVFNLAKNVVFRLILLLTGWSPVLSHLLKGRIRKMLMLGQRPAPIHFQRTVAFSEDSIHITDQIIKKDGSRVTALSCADEFSVRYVPQSRYFQSHELRRFKQEMSAQQLHDLNATGSLTLTRRVSMGTDHVAK